MNETENTRLLRLYKLLWEQIKDREKVYLLIWHTQYMTDGGIISYEEMRLIDKDIIDKGYLAPKPFVQRQIKELENDK